MSTPTRPVSLSPSWVDDVPAHRRPVEPTASDPHDVRQHNAAVLRAIEARVASRIDGLTTPRHLSDWFNGLARDADRQAELWAAAAQVLRAEASTWGDDELDEEVANREVCYQLQGRANEISSGQQQPT